MRETTMETIQKDGHKWEITRRLWPTNAALYAVYRDGEFWSTADSYREAMEEIEDETDQ